MISLLLSVAVLVSGFVVYGRLTERVFAPDDRMTPAVAVNDGVDCVPMKPWKAFLVQLLNIAGTGPIFGALMGACFGPVVFLWIVFGSILGGAVHDYMSGMISSRHQGASIAELSGGIPRQRGRVDHAGFFHRAPDPDGHGFREQSGRADRPADSRLPE